VVIQQRNPFVDPEKWWKMGYEWEIHGISMGCTHGYGLKMGMDKITGVSKSMRDTQNGNLQNGNLARCIGTCTAITQLGVS
jgi:hypothetical protein